MKTKRTTSAGARETGALPKRSRSSLTTLSDSQIPQICEPNNINECDTPISKRVWLMGSLKASIKSLLPLKRPSNYTLLVRVVNDEGTRKDLIFGCTDDQVTPVRDETARVKFDSKLGPFFQLQPGIPHKYFYWRSLPQMDKQMYVWFRDQIYDGRSLAGLYWLCFLPLPLVVAVGMFASVKLDLRMNRDYEAGDLLRGVRILKASEYARELNSRDAGIGIPALRPERAKS